MGKSKPKTLWGRYEELVTPPQRLQRKGKENTSSLKCYMCMPAKSWNKHKSPHGIIIHKREDCPSGMLYMTNADNLEQK